MPSKIYQDTEGVLLKIDMGESIALATDYSLKVKTPSNELRIWIPTIGEANKFYYETQVGDLDEIGKYIIQPFFTIGTWTGPGYPVSFSVLPPIL